MKKSDGFEIILNILKDADAIDLTRAQTADFILSELESLGLIRPHHFIKENDGMFKILNGWETDNA